MKKILIILSTLILTSCGSISNIKNGAVDSFKNIGKNPCYDKEKNTTKIFGCKKK
ncbi:hypothetical protein [Candidatus Pelagibacter sp. Uisw_130]|uniref:hypothetical protein n=1 Tax=Candidatus Pelagibacter sp. Uisw_130 TaxID=3230989 RepID=UPI0039EA0521